MSIGMCFFCRSPVFGLIQGCLVHSLIEVQSLLHLESTDFPETLLEHVVENIH